MESALILITSTGILSWKKKGKRIREFGKKEFRKNSVPGINFIGLTPGRVAEEIAKSILGPYRYQSYPQFFNNGKSGKSEALLAVPG